MQTQRWRSATQRVLFLLCYNYRASKWRYRLGVRTEDSQSSNPGSIPGSATIQSPLQRNLTKSPTKQKELPVLCDSFYETRAEKTLLSNDNAFYRPFSPGAQERSEFCKPTWRIIGDHKPKSLRTRLDFPVFSVVRSDESCGGNAHECQPASLSVNTDSL